MAVKEPIVGLVPIKVAAEWLDIPWTTLRDMVTAQAVPHTRVGKHVRFGQHHLDAIVEAGERRVATAPSRATVTAIRAANPPKTEPPRTPPPPTGPRTPPPPTGPKRADGKTSRATAA